VGLGEALRGAALARARGFVLTGVFVDVDVNVNVDADADADADGRD
jgi:hypothetical protein